MPGANHDIYPVERDYYLKLNVVQLGFIWLDQNLMNPDSKTISFQTQRRFE